ncbi:MAG: NAD(P)/FAD-dependent oxidoreductase [Dehalococcoidia bacterium]
MRIAIVGAGVSGLVAAYLLRREHQVQIFEANAYAGGHANTVMVTAEDGRELPLDVGFIVYNERTYPGFTRLLAELGVESQASDMSFSVRCEEEDFEFSSRGARGYLAQPRNLLRPSHYRMLLDVVRFQRDARRALRRDEGHDISFDEYLERRGFSQVFRQRLIVPLLASTWSNAPSNILSFPAHYLFRFLETHGVLAPNSIPEWRWVKGGAQSYIARLLATLPEGTLNLAAPVAGVSRSAEGVSLDLGEGDVRAFDAVVLACHSDQALAMLHDADEEERGALGGLRYQPNRVVLHTDAHFLPRREAARAAWNYHAETSRTLDLDTLTMTYDLNRLQGMDGETHYCVSTNPSSALDESKVIASFDYSHPVFEAGTIAAQARLRQLNGRRQTYFAGAYLGYGFHEDGLQSGVEVARLLGVQW